MSTTLWKIIRFKEGGFSTLEDEVVEEVPVTIFVNAKEIVTLLTMGENSVELAVGFLRSEGFLSSKEDILDLDESEGSVYLKIGGDTALIEKLMEKRTLTSGCGKGTTFYHPLDALRVRELDTEVYFGPEEIMARMSEIQVRSEVFQRTGGTHNASLASPERTILFRADIGRHNAVDMIGGRTLLDGIAVEKLALFTTGRISSEILLKTAKMGVAVLVSRSAPTSLALRLGEKLGMTVVGYVRGGRFNVYTNPWRVRGAAV